MQFDDYHRAEITSVLGPRQPPDDGTHALIVPFQQRCTIPTCTTARLGNEYLHRSYNLFHLHALLMATSTVLPAAALTSSFGTSSCPRCHTPLPNATTPEDTQRRMLDLEAQVKLLNSKAAAAVDKLADAEDELRFLRAVHARSQHGGNGNTASPPPDHTPEQLRPQAQSRLSSLSAFLPGRRNSPQTPNTTTFPPTPPAPSVTQRQVSNASTSTPNLLNGAQERQSENDLSTLLQHERAARQSAEQSLNRAHSELEELTAQLFGQANEMVATERKARVKLEERVQVLEKRDSDKRRRLERLEKAIERIERVRQMVRS